MTTLVIQPGQSFTITVERVSVDVTDVQIKTGSLPPLLFAHYRLMSLDPNGVYFRIFGDGSLILSQ